MRFLKSLPRVPQNIEVGDIVTVERHDRWGNVNFRFLATVEKVWDIAKSATVKKKNGRRVSVDLHNIMRPHVAQIPTRLG